ncbi:hypothetical protein [Oceanospirillum linum]|uniref:VacJ n=1 Tax=Oceanospirillum linum TaxID=966 RepID=A0A1T1HFS2_OCELI|nr:hypothetical protein [Oceanospirillum linum]OOV88666.1 hypothetical protein BTA35_0204075 [Oceanospirillum linum]SEG03401.1 hypothetical protein SAMN04489856_104173 [Oleiphilus messinensis]SMP21205.1 hypothetical protein SAMN06264348_10486 [Oceanospirillum linum]
MKMLNRSAMTVKLTQEFVDWINNLDDGSEPLTLSDVNEEATVYLIPEIEDEEQLREMTQEFWLNILENELKSWEDDESSWPELTEELFEQFIDLSPAVMVFDLDYENGLKSASIDDLEDTAG